MKSVLRNRNFAVLFSGQLVSTFGNNLYLIALPLYVLDVTSSKSDLAIVGFAQTLPAVIGLFAGVLVDRWNKRSTMIISDLVRAIIAAGIGILALSVAHTMRTFYVVVLLVLLLELAGTVFSPAQFAIIPQVVTQAQLVSANGLNQSGQAFAKLIGSVSGGVLMSTLGAPLLFLFNAASYVFSVISLFFVDTNENPIKSNRDPLLKAWWQGIVIIWGMKILFRAVVASVIANFVLIALNMILAAWVKDAMHGPSWSFGLLVGAELAGIMLGGISTSPLNKRFKLIRMLTFYSIINGFCIAMIGLIANLYWDMMFMFVIGTMIAGFNSAISTVLMTTIPSDYRARVYATGGAATRLGTPVGIAIFGFLIVHVQLRIVFLIAGLLMVVCGLLYVSGKTVPAKSQRNLPDSTEG